MKVVEMDLDSVAAKFNAGLASLAVLQRQQVQQGQALGLLGCGDGDGEIWKESRNGFSHGSGCGGLITPSSLPSLSADSNKPRQRRKRSSLSRARGQSVSQGEVEVDRGAESDCSTISSTHPSGRQQL